MPVPISQDAPLSNAGGYQPRWSADGKEPFYLSPDAEVMAMPITLGSSFEAGLPVLFKSRVIVNDSLNAVKRFLLNTPTGEAAPTPFSVVLHAVK